MEKYKNIYLGCRYPGFLIPEIFFFHILPDLLMRNQKQLLEPKP